MEFVLVNAFSVNMLAREGHDLAFRPVNVEAFQNLNRNHGLVSAVGHADTAAVLSTLLSFDVACNRANVTLDRDHSLVVAQYRGPRLPEGATELPAGATIEFWQVYHI